MLDGTFAIEGNAFTLLSGPKFTADALRVLSGIIERAARKEITPEELEKQVSEIDEDFGNIVKEAFKKGGPGIAFLLLLVLFLKGCHFNLDAKVDLNTLWNQIVSAQHGVIYDPSKSDHGIEKTDANKSSDGGHTASKGTRKKVH
jgi:hypothetical protein